MPLPSTALLRSLSPPPPAPCAEITLDEMGLPQDSPTPIAVDNSGAVELSRDLKSCHRSRHVDRRYFKVRELSYEGVVTVQKIDTKLNPADVLTKPLPQDAFDRHVKALMNMP